MLFTIDFIIIHYIIMDINKYRKNFGKTIRYYRKKQKLTLEDLAEKCDLNSKYLSRVELGTANISFDNIIKISFALNIEPYRLMLFPDVNTPAKEFLDIIHTISTDTQKNLKLYLKIISDIKELTN